MPVAILRVLFTARWISREINVLQCRVRRCGEAKKEVDEHRETLHNLTSLLLTNKTIRGMQQGSTGYRSLTINSR